MRTIDIVQDGEPVMVRVTNEGRPIAQHVIHAVGPGGSLAYFKGGPGVPDNAPNFTGSSGATPSTPSTSHTTASRS